MIKLRKGTHVKIIGKVNVENWWYLNRTEKIKRLADIDKFGVWVYNQKGVKLKPYSFNRGFRGHVFLPDNTGKKTDYTILIHVPIALWGENVKKAKMATKVV